jgi:hypothetical protein
MATSRAAGCSCKLPPLILHPFSDSAGPGKLVESSRASLILQGLLPKEGFTVEELERALVSGRNCEIRMLYYVGKDVLRWVEQCVEVAGREERFQGRQIEARSFITLLVDTPPIVVEEKLKNWGVADYKSIFARSIALNVLFANVPGPGDLSDEFVRNYFRYVDQIYLCYRSQTAFAPLTLEEVDFDLFASGEYSRLLEREWSEPASGV